MTTNSSAQSAWFTLIIIFVCALVPMALAFGLYFWPPKNLTLDTMHHGQLLSPPIQLEQTGTKWQLVQITLGSECQQAPESASAGTNSDSSEPSLAYTHAQIIKALGREAHRVSPGYVCLTDLPTSNHPVLTGIIDPNNQLIMTYEPDATKRGILLDLKRLLKYNKLG
jgi:hypothetical protein